MKKSVIVAIHLGYWVMYASLIGIVFLALSNGPGGGPNPGLHFFKLNIGFSIIPGVIGFYAFYAFLFSKFLKQKKILALITSALGVSIVSAFIGEIIMSLVFFRDNIIKIEGESIIGITIMISLITLINGILGLVIRGFINWYDDIKIKEELSRKNFETELALVKSQINPHFLFNTINNIDTLIGIDPQKASAYLNKLSDIMRFMLYETKTEEISLATELSYIDKYIELQKIRSSNPNYVTYITEGEPGNLKIAPMLFIPYIENAFKHAESKKAENAITIRIAIEKDKLTFECENLYNEKLQSKSEHGGLGNELLKKRLSLLYPKRHSIEVSNKYNAYKVKLVIKQ